MIKCCKHCNHTRPGTDARAIGRFTPGGPLGYKANYMAANQTRLEN